MKLWVLSLDLSQEVIPLNEGFGDNSIKSEQLPHRFSCFLPGQEDVLTPTGHGAPKKDVGCPRAGQCHMRFEVLDKHYLW